MVTLRFRVEAIEVTVAGDEITRRVKLQAIEQANPEVPNGYIILNRANGDFELDAEYEAVFTKLTPGLSVAVARRGK